MFDFFFFFFGPLSEINHTLIEEESEPCCSYLWMIFPSHPLKLLLCIVAILEKHSFGLEGH